MAEHTHIEWTDATWNPITGCTVVSEGCRNCYAMTLAGTRLADHPSRSGLTRRTADGRHVWTGEVRLNAQWLDQPLRWKRPRRIFVCAHGDLFHDAVPDAWIDQVMAVIFASPDHVFQVLTKRPERMRQYFASRTTSHGEGWADRVHEHVIDLLPRMPTLTGRGRNTHKLASYSPLPNLWLGVSVEDQATADARISILLDTPAAVRWISAEPLLGPVDLVASLHRCGAHRDGDCWRSWCPQLRDNEPARSGRHCPADRWDGDPFTSVNVLDWVVVGGESGPGSRPMHVDWARALRDQCRDAGVPFFFKQWGDWAPVEMVYDAEDQAFDAAYPIVSCCANPNAHTHEQDALFWQDGEWMQWPHLRPADAIGARRVGKARAGRLLDGVTHDQQPAEGGR